MNTEYARRTNNKWDCSAGFHARATANGYSPDPMRRVRERDPERQRCGK
jgi:hypothetical protein